MQVDSLYTLRLADVSQRLLHAVPLRSLLPYPLIDVGSVVILGCWAGEVLRVNARMDVTLPDHTRCRIVEPACEFVEATGPLHEGNPAVGAPVTCQPQAFHRAKWLTARPVAAWPPKTAVRATLDVVSRL